MARDLIPPPSPAGRPAPDEPSPLDARAPRAPEPPAPAAGPARPGGPTPFRGRFGFLLGALIGTGVAAAVLAGVLVATAGNPPDGLAKDWSSWKPSSGATSSGAAEIADHIGKHYRMVNGDQLVAVTGGPLAIQSVPLSIALRPVGGDIQVLEGHGVLYTLNGLGPRGSIREGKPSKARHLLLRREALELALYSFRYLDGVNMVVTLLPPAPPQAKAATPAKGKKGAKAPAAAPTPQADTTQPQTQAIFYRPGDLKPQLQVPLRATMSAGTPPPPESYKGAEARRVDTLTISNLFLASVQQAQDTKAYLVLDRPS